MSDDKQEQVEQFVDLTGASVEDANFFLECSDNLETAFNAYFDSKSKEEKQSNDDNENFSTRQADEAKFDVLMPSTSSSSLITQTKQAKELKQNKTNSKSKFTKSIDANDTLDDNDSTNSISRSTTFTKVPKQSKIPKASFKITNASRAKRQLKDIDTLDVNVVQEKNDQNLKSIESSRQNENEEKTQDSSNLNSQTSKISEDSLILDKLDVSLEPSAEEKHTNIAVRIDKTRFTRRFYLSDTIRDVYNWVLSQVPEDELKTKTNWILVSAFPRQKFTNRLQTIEQGKMMNQSLYLERVEDCSDV